MPHHDSLEFVLSKIDTFLLFTLFYLSRKNHTVLTFFVVLWPFWINAPQLFLLFFLPSLVPSTGGWDLAALCYITIQMEYATPPKGEMRVKSPWQEEAVVWAVLIQDEGKSRNLLGNHMWKGGRFLSCVLVRGSPWAGRVWLLAFDGFVLPWRGQVTKGTHWDM